MAPELVDDSTIAPSMASDVYSWALTSYEILSTCLPYHDRANAPLVNFGALRTAMQVVAGTLRPDLSLVREDCPPALVSLVRRAWDSDPRKRPAMAAVVREVAAMADEAARCGDGGGGGGGALPGQVDN